MMSKENQAESSNLIPTSSNTQVGMLLSEQHPSPPSSSLQRDSSSHLRPVSSTFESRIPSYIRRGSVPMLPFCPLQSELLSKRRTSIPKYQSLSKKTILTNEFIAPTDSLLSEGENDESSDSDKQNTLTREENGDLVDLDEIDEYDYCRMDKFEGKQIQEEEEEKEKENIEGHQDNEEEEGGDEVRNGEEDDEEEDLTLTQTTEFVSSGRIQVFVRVRPALPRDPNQREKSLHIKHDNLIFFHSSPSNSNYVFDHIFEESHCDDLIFRKVGKPIVKACVKGFNGTLIAYGQTGSGKTHTLFSQAGLLPLTLHALYESLSCNTSPYSVALSMIQIYQEKIYDLLANDVEVELREHPQLGVYLERGTKLEALTYQTCQLMVSEGYQHRIVKETLMNQSSSRSHVIVFLEVSQTFGHVMKQSKLTFCDLAGSERIKKTLASGTILNEAKEINLSLLEMGNVIQSLANRQKHIPYRNSVLTRLLQESLGGNCLTSLIICVSPCKRDLPETKGSLSFGKRAMRIKTYAKVNEQVDHEKLASELSLKLSNLETKWMERERELQRTIDFLKRAHEASLEKLNHNVSSFDPESTLEHRQLLIERMENVQLSSKQEETVTHEMQNRVYDSLVKRLVNCLALSLEEGSTTLTKLLASVEYLEDKLESERREKLKSKSKSKCIIQ